MTELRNYILSKLEEKIDFSKETIQGKAARATAAGALRAVKSRFEQSGLAKKAGDAAKLAKEYSQETYKQKPKPPKPENSSTDLRTQLAYVLADKLEELKLPQGGIDRDKQNRAVRGENYARDVKKAAFTAITGRQAPEKVGVKPSGEVDVGDSASRAHLPKYEKGSPALKKAGKHFQGKGPILGLKRPKPEKTAEPPRYGSAREPKPENSSTILKDRMVDILLERKVNSFLERTDEGIIGGGLRGLYQGVKKSFNKDYNPEASKQASIETHGIRHTAAQHAGRLAGRTLGGAIKTAGAALRGGGRGIVQGIKKSRDASYNPEAHKQANSATQGLVSAYSQKAGQAVGKGLGAAGGAIKKGAGAAGGMIKRGFNKMMQRESSAYDRITNMLLESRVEMFIQDRLDERNKGNRAKVKSWQAQQGNTPADPQTKEDRLRIGRKHLDKGPKQGTPAQVATDKSIERQINKGKK